MNEIVLSGNIILNDDYRIYLLFRNKHAHYETPGGKLEENESLEETAKRELLEEVSGINVISMDYFGSVAFLIPDGRKAIAHKFITKIKGNPYPNETLFDKDKSKWINLSDLEKEPISPDLKLFLPKLKSSFLQ
ncbi:NUDIX domain-containing protein [Candidatus Woesearchaeota archaeon]|nr:NUDIX domain-containing protein [Candidatus Woesearchaeota archaeon]MCF7901496.1 NUDIX domain-containing protein [Candidatus Woesearchaeota archaeon]MCF8013918.1 NUDIX domain-containing protein [Candidatus Woesearchaeota archaeon]